MSNLSRFLKICFEHFIFMLQNVAIVEIILGTAGKTNKQIVVVLSEVKWDGVSA